MPLRVATIAFGEGANACRNGASVRAGDHPLLVVGLHAYINPKPSADTTAQCRRRRSSSPRASPPSKPRRNISKKKAARKNVQLEDSVAKTVKKAFQTVPPLIKCESPVPRSRSRGKKNRKSSSSDFSSSAGSSGSITPSSLRKLIETTHARIRPSKSATRSKDSRSRKVSNSLPDIAKRRHAPLNRPRTSPAKSSRPPLLFSQL